MGRQYKLHNYDNKCISAVGDGPPKTIGATDVIFHIDFSACPKLPAARALNSAGQSRLVILQSHSAAPSSTQPPVTHRRHTVSHLHWTGDLTQDPAAVNRHRTAAFEQLTGELYRWPIEELEDTVGASRQVADPVL